MKKGFTLIEVMIAVFITIVGVSGMYALVPHIMKASSLNTDKFIAAQLAREGIEIMRNTRDSNFLYMLYQDFNADWDASLTSGAGAFACRMVNGCEVNYTMIGEPWGAGQPRIFPDDYGANGRYLRIDANGFYNYTSGSQTKFKRRIKTTAFVYGAGSSFGDNGITITATVYWGDQSFVVEDKIYNWR